MFSHQFPEEYQCSPAIAPFRDVTLEHFAFVIDDPPQVVPHAVDLHENLVQMPLPFARLHALNSTLPNLICEHWAEAVPPKPNRLVAYFNTALVQQVLNVTKRKWEPYVKHHGQADDLWTRLEIAKRSGFGHPMKLSRTLPRIKQVSSDSTAEGV